MSLAPLPAFAVWRHRGTRDGTEVTFFESRGGDTVATGTTVGVEAAEPWVVNYRIELDTEWRTRRADISTRTSAGEQTVRLDHDGLGRWQLNGRAISLLDGCLDVDLESSALTNAFPAHRLAEHPNHLGAVSAPAAFVRATDLSVERLEQRYRTLPAETSVLRFDYAAPIFEVSCVLSYDASGLVLDYPGLAVRLE